MDQRRRTSLCAPLLGSINASERDFTQSKGNLMDHVRLLNGVRNESLVSGHKSLTSRAVGRFYTHEIIGKHLATAVLRVAAKRSGRSFLRLADPFCGDGRLVVWLMERASRIETLKRLSWRIDVWDCEMAAVQEAYERISAKADELGMRVHINAVHRDSFVEAPQNYGQFDIVTTNPPWEILKPDQRELRGLTPQEAVDYIGKLKERNKRLSLLFPLSKPKMMFSGWGTNLARLGSEIALRLTAPEGVCGIVSPASLLADQISEDLRRWFFTGFRVTDLAYYPAEARLFQHVDQPAISVVAKHGSSANYSAPVAFYQSNARSFDLSRLLVRRDRLEQNAWVLPLHLGVSGIELLSKFRRWPQLREFESANPPGLWVGRELDETGHHRFLDEAGDFLFIKGRMIRRFGLVEQPSRFVKHDGPRIPGSASVWRVAWRDVARPSQKRRMHATIIPPGWVTGNSLSVAYFRDHNRDRLLALLAVMNSLVFEFQVRAHLSTAHLSLGTIRQVRIPDLSDKGVVQRLARIAKRCVRDRKFDTCEFEAVVAEEYGLHANEFRTVLSSFHKIDTVEVHSLLEAIQ